MQSVGVVDVVDEVWQIGGNVIEGFILRGVDRLDPAADCRRHWLELWRIVVTNSAANVSVVR